MRTLFGRRRLIEDEDAVGTVQARAKQLLQGRDERTMRPGRLREEALQGPRGSARNGLGDVFGVTAIGMLDQEAAQILFTPALGFGPPKQRGEVSMEAGEGVGNPIQVFWCHEQ